MTQTTHLLDHIDKGNAYPVCTPESPVSSRDLYSDDPERVNCPACKGAKAPKGEKKEE